MKELGLSPWTEQAVPAWDTNKKKAILDIAYLDPRTGPRYIDVAVVAGNIHAHVEPKIRIERHEKLAHRRYPGPALVPFVMDIRGTWGREALSWVKDLKPFLPPQDRDRAFLSLRWRLSSSVQSSVADAILRSSTATRRPRPPPAASTAPVFVCAAMATASTPTAIIRLFSLF